MLSVFQYCMFFRYFVEDKWFRNPWKPRWSLHLACFMLLLCFAFGIFGIFFKTFLPLKWGNGSGFLRLEGVICVTETWRYVSRFILVTMKTYSCIWNHFRSRWNATVFSRPYCRNSAKSSRNGQSFFSEMSKDFKMFLWEMCHTARWKVPCQAFLSPPPLSPSSFKMSTPLTLKKAWYTGYHIPQSISC